MLTICKVLDGMNQRDKQTFLSFVVVCSKAFLLATATTATAWNTPCSRQDTRCWRGVSSTCAAAQALQGWHQQLVGIRSFPEIQQIRWPSIKKGRTRPQYMTWSFRETTHTCTASMRRCFICSYDVWGGCHRRVIPTLFLVLVVIHPPTPCPLCSQRDMIRRRSDLIDVNTSSIFWGVAGLTIDSALIVAVTVGHWSCWAETWVIPQLRYKFKKQFEVS